MLEHLVVPVTWESAGELTVTPALKTMLAARKIDATDGQYLEGYASTFGNVDLGGDVVKKGAFRKTIQKIKGEGIPLLADHMPTVQSVLGTIFDAREDTKGLRIKALWSSAPSAQDAYVKGSEGHLNKMSIGYEPMDYSFEERDGRTVRVLEEIKLWECSVVVFPMNPEAVISRVKGWLDQADDVTRAALTDELRKQVGDLTELKIVLPAAKAAAPSHSTEVREGTWDAGVNIGRMPSPMPVSMARRMFALYDASKVSDGKIPKTACSLPHHFTDSGGNPGAASLSAVRNGLARVNQVQGYSDAEKASATAHLRSHLDAATASVDPDLDTGSEPVLVPGTANPDEGKATGTPDDGVRRESPGSPAGDDPAAPPDDGGTGKEHHWDRWASAAVMAGHDPSLTVSAADRVGLETRLDLLAADLDRLRNPDSGNAGSESHKQWNDVLGAYKYGDLPDSIAELEDHIRDDDDEATDG